MAFGIKTVVFNKTLICKCFKFRDVQYHLYSGKKPTEYKKKKKGLPCPKCK